MERESTSVPEAKERCVSSFKNEETKNSVRNSLYQQKRAKI